MDRLGRRLATTSTSAEVAFVTAEDHRREGLASQFLARLADTALTVGIIEFIAETLPDNRRMLGVFARSGLLVATAFHGGLIDVSMSLRPADPIDGARSP